MASADLPEFWQESIPIYEHLAVCRRDGFPRDSIYGKIGPSEQI